MDRTGSAHGWGMEGGAHRANVRRPWARLALVLPALLVCALCAIAFVRASDASRLRGPGRTELEAGIDGYLEVRSPACLHRTSATHRQQSHLPLASGAVLCCQLPGTAESGAHLSGCVSPCAATMCGSRHVRQEPCAAGNCLSAAHGEQPGTCGLREGRFFIAARLQDIRVQGASMGLGVGLVLSLV